MEATGKIYEPFLGEAIREGLIEYSLRAGDFNLWTTTEHPRRIMISFGGRDSLDVYKYLQGYIQKEDFKPHERLRIYATGRNLIEYLDQLNLD
jgi:hypothetical protein